MRAVMIGVGIFIILITLTAVITYVNVAKDMATAVDKGLNEWDEININNVMDFEGNVTINVSGIDLINFIRKNVSREDIRLRLGQFTEVYDDISIFRNSIGNASEEKLLDINPNAKIQMQKIVESDGTILITVIGDIWIIKQPEPGIIYGDLNGNGILDIEDFNILNKYVSNVLTEEEKVQADVNGDGVVNYTDFDILKEYVNGVPTVELKNATGDVNMDGDVNYLDRDKLQEYVFTDIQREKADINLDRIVDKEDVDKLREELMKIGVEIPTEDAEEVEPE